MPQYEILGKDLQYLKVMLGEGEAIYADAGHMVAKQSSVTMKTTMRGGFFGALKREITGGSFFVTEFLGPGEAYLSGVFPGPIVQIQLQGNGILAESHSFLCAENSVNYDATLNKLSVGWLGGEGIFLARFRGYGNVFLHAYGGLIEKYLNPGEKLQVEASHLMAFEEGMRYGIQPVGGIKSLLFSGEGLFFVNVEGPGKIWLHTLTVEQLVASLRPYLPQGQQGGPGFSIRI
ncbi:Uncharacterized protein J5U23_01340 [Saccharolobus shibatae B12]|uniref:TIGR00266 family protein n=1 Tax=Saccharolobus shibatae (strain ATCC 51178 / DSM 5389 / JCM 8931 / NBRC 15437 / B12) TaxID=523848 RepID=A0A8F5GT63_SACSH|nr:TIGR00266 family protein [Saccharolobus shibatae]QXJ28471.1 Uncharacterized protein J5U23_01340 [Saccharolobus shibatae B12]